MKKSLKILILVIVLVLLMVSLTGCISTDTGSKTTLTSQDNITNENNVSVLNKKYNVGEIYEDSNIAIKYVSKDDNFKGYNKYATVKSGYKVIKAEFEFENVGSSDAYVSSYEFNCYADGYACENFYSIDDIGFSSTLSKGKKAKGSVYFEVPVSANSVTIEYETNMFTSKKVEFIVK